MNTILPIDAAGRLVLPAAVRRRLGLEAGSQLRLAIVADRIELTPVDTSPELVRSPTGRMVLKATGVPFDAATTVRAERDRQALPRNKR